MFRAITFLLVLLTAGPAFAAEDEKKGTIACDGCSTSYQSIAAFAYAQAFGRQGGQGWQTVTQADGFFVYDTANGSLHFVDMAFVLSDTGVAISLGTLFTYTVRLPNGEVLVKVYARDSNGNWVQSGTRTYSNTTGSPLCARCKRKNRKQ